MSVKFKDYFVSLSSKVYLLLSNSEVKTIEEKKAEVLIKLRGYKLLERREIKEAAGFIVEDPKSGQKIMVWCIPGENLTIGVQYINKLKKAMKEAGIERGIIISRGRYTQAAKQNARKKGIELLPKTFPAFNIFEHVLVPKHEILSPEEREELLAKYRVKPYQLPKIRASDPAVKAIGAKPGDIVRIIRRSSTAGEHVVYRYVIEG